MADQICASLSNEDVIGRQGADNDTVVVTVDDGGEETFEDGTDV